MIICGHCGECVEPAHIRDCDGPDADDEAERPRDPEAAFRERRQKRRRQQKREAGRAERRRLGRDR